MAVNLKALATALRDTARAQSAITALVSARTYVIPFMQGFMPNYITPFVGIHYAGGAERLGYEKPESFVEATAWDFYAFERQNISDWESSIMKVLEIIDAIRDSMNDLNSLTGYSGPDLISIRAAEPPTASSLVLPVLASAGDTYYVAQQAIRMIVQRSVQ